MGWYNDFDLFVLPAQISHECLHQFKALLDDVERKRTIALLTVLMELCSFFTVISCLLPNFNNHTDFIEKTELNSYSNTSGKSHCHTYSSKYLTGHILHPLHIFLL